MVYLPQRDCMIPCDDIVLQHKLKSRRAVSTHQVRQNSIERICLASRQHSKTLLFEKTKNKQTSQNKQQKKNELRCCMSLLKLFGP